MFSLIFLIAALVILILAGIGVASGRLNLTAIGLACFVASVLVGRV